MLAVVDIPTMAMVGAFCLTVARVPEIGAVDHVMSIRRAAARRRDVGEARLGLGRRQYGYPSACDPEMGNQLLR